MGLFDFLFGKKKKEEEITGKTVEYTENIQKPLIRRGCITTVKVEVSSGNYDEICHAFIAFDTETTGLSSSSDVIIELGAVKFIDGNVAESYSTLVNEGKPVPDAAYLVNHISTQMLRSQGKSPETAYQEFTNFLGDALSGQTCLCAHNASFDMAFLKNTLERLGYSGVIKYIDTLSLSRSIVKGLTNYKLDTLAKHFNLNNKDAHRAVADAEVCGGILVGLLPMKLEEIEKEKDRNEKCKPTEEEKEIFSIIANGMKNNGSNVENIRTYRNSSCYVDVIDVYTIFKFKLAKKKSYVVLPKRYLTGIEKTENCTNSEGIDNLRLLFDDPFELEEYGCVFSKIYEDIKKDQGKNMNIYEAQFLAQANLTGFTEAEIGTHIENAKRRKILKAELQQQALKEEKERLEKKEERRKERNRLKKEQEDQREKKKAEKNAQREAIVQMFDNMDNITEEQIEKIVSLSANQGKRAILQMDDVGQILRVYESVTEASKVAGISTKTIRDVANGRYKHGGGFCWKYADEKLNVKEQ